MFQTFNAQGVKFGRRTSSLQTAITRVKPLNGEVREYGTLNVVYTCKTALPQSLQAAQLRAQALRVQPLPTLAPVQLQFPLYIPARAAYPGTSIRVCR